MTQQKKDLDSFALVVLGDMNPAIHHPAWYKISTIISEEEYQAAISDKVGPVLVTGPVGLAKFRFEGITITCQHNRWQIEAPADRADKCLEILGKTFDVLGETPISVFGSNYHFHRRSAQPNVGPFLGDKVKGSGIGLVDGGHVTVLSVKTGMTTTTLRPSPMGPEFIHVHVNVTHAIEVTEEPIHFDLGPLVSEAEAEDRTAASLIISQVMSAIGQAG